jgi:hypothetical protein
MRTRSETNNVYQVNTPNKWYSWYWENVGPNKDSWTSQTLNETGVAIDKIAGSSSSVITDELIAAHRIKEVHHSKSNIRYLPGGGFADEVHRISDNYGEYRHEFISGEYALQNYLCGAYNWWRLLQPSDITVNWFATDDALLSSALHKFMDGNEVDNLTNIRESGQTVDMVRSMGETWKSSLLWMPSRRLLKRGRLVPDWSRAAKFYGRKVRDLVKSTPGALANGWLAYSFGIAPLVSDLKKMAVGFSSLQSQLVRNRHKGQRRIVHSTCGGDISVAINDAVYGAPYGIGDSTTRHLTLSIENMSALKVATVHGKDTTSYNTDLFKDLDYMMKRFLSAGPASALWEAIPYSFVLDWFVNTSAVIDKVDNSLTGGVRRVVDGCVSTKLVVEGVSKVLLPQYNTNYVRTQTMDGREFGRSEISEYHRLPALPSFWIGKSGRFGKRQGSLLGALLHQKVASLKLHK